MANPQKEDGYTAIANEIMDALCRIRIPGAERSVLDAILRKTYGWNKCEDELSMGQISDMTGLHRSNVARALKYLTARKIILVIRDDSSKCNVLKFNKNYEEWVLSGLITVINGDSKGVIRSAKKGVISTDTHKRKNIQKQVKSRIEVPEWVPRDTFSEYLEMRKRIKKPLIESSFHRFFKSLKKLCDDTNGSAEAILSQSILNSWQGIFALKQQQGGNGGGAYQRLDKFGRPIPRQKWEDEADRINAEYYASKAKTASNGETGENP